MNVLRNNAVMTACARTTMVDTTVNAMPLVTIKSITKESVNVRFFLKNTFKIGGGFPKDIVEKCFLLYSESFKSGQRINGKNIL